MEKNGAPLMSADLKWIREAGDDELPHAWRLQGFDEGLFQIFVEECQSLEEGKRPRTRYAALVLDAQGREVLKGRVFDKRVLAENEAVTYVRRRLLSAVVILAPLRGIA
jgi:hypothetical protein